MQSLYQTQTHRKVTNVSFISGEKSTSYHWTLHIAFDPKGNIKISFSSLFRQKDDFLASSRLVLDRDYGIPDPQYFGAMF